MRQIITATLLAASALLVASPSQAVPIVYAAVLSGPNESPPNGSLGTGFATAIIDTTAHTLNVTVMFTGLTGTTTLSHIHCCTAVPGVSTTGIATVTPSFTGFPTGVTSGSYTSPTFLLDTADGWNPAFITANGGTPGSAEAAFAAGLAAGTAYLNIHTSFVPGGDIRGFRRWRPSQRRSPSWRRACWVWAGAEGASAAENSVLRRTAQPASAIRRTSKGVLRALPWPEFGFRAVPN